MSNEQPTAALVGAGVSGLSCAAELTRAGWRVRLFDKGRRPGGRISSRRNDAGVSFDHGAQYFTAREPAFVATVEAWIRAGVVAPWDARVQRLGPTEGDDDNSERDGTTVASVRYVGTPTMSAVARHLAVGLDVQTGVRIGSVTATASGWRLVDVDGVEHGRFDAVGVTVPAGQATPLLEAAPALRERARATPMSPCWAVMAVFAEPLELPFDAAFVRGSALSWVARNSSKPGRAPADAWVLHASPTFSESQWETPKADMTRRLLAEFSAATGRTLPDPTYTDTHRWRYALPTAAVAEHCLIDDSRTLGACGDWCGGPRVEGAVRSGRALAEAFIAARSS